MQSPESKDIMGDTVVLKCSPLHCCSILSSKIEDANHKDFVFIHATNIMTSEKRLLGVVYKTSVRDPGIMLNFCPFCGERIDWFNKEQI